MHGCTHVVDMYLGGPTTSRSGRVKRSARAEPVLNRDRATSASTTWNWSHVRMGRCKATMAGHRRLREILRRNFYGLHSIRNIYPGHVPCLHLVIPGTQLHNSLSCSEMISSLLSLCGANSTACASSSAVRKCTPADTPTSIYGLGTIAMGPILADPGCAKTPLRIAFSMVRRSLQDDDVRQRSYSKPSFASPHNHDAKLSSPAAARQRCAPLKPHLTINRISISLTRKPTLLSSADGRPFRPSEPQRVLLLHSNKRAKMSCRAIEPVTDSTFVWIKGLACLLHNHGYTRCVQTFQPHPFLSHVKIAG